MLAQISGKGRAVDAARETGVVFVQGELKGVEKVYPNGRKILEVQFPSGAFLWKPYPGWAEIQTHWRDMGALLDDALAAARQAVIAPQPEVEEDEETVPGSKARKARRTLQRRISNLEENIGLILEKLGIQKPPN